MPGKLAHRRHRPGIEQPRRQNALARALETRLDHLRPSIARRVVRRGGEAITPRGWRAGDDRLGPRHFPGDVREARGGQSRHDRAEIGSGKALQHQIGKRRRQVLGEDFRQRHAQRPQLAGEPRCPPHQRRPARVRDAQHDGRAIREADLVDVVLRAGGEAPHLERSLADGSGRQLACQRLVRYIRPPSRPSTVPCPANGRDCQSGAQTKTASPQRTPFPSFAPNGA